MKATSNRIEDGYTKPGYIMAVEGLHDALQFEYRPMLPEQVDDLDNEIAKTNGGKAAAMLIAAAMVGQLTAWSEVDRKTKQPLPITIDNVRRQPYPVLGRLRKIVSGLIPSDPLPEPTEAEASEYVASLKAQIDGHPAGLAILAADKKN